MRLMAQLNVQHRAGAQHARGPQLPTQHPLVTAPDVHAAQESGEIRRDVDPDQSGEMVAGHVLRHDHPVG
jgi:hypothetical protein